MARNSDDLNSLAYVKAYKSNLKELVLTPKLRGMSSKNSLGGSHVGGLLKRFGRAYPTVSRITDLKTLMMV